MSAVTDVEGNKLFLRQTLDLVYGYNVPIFVRNKSVCSLFLREYNVNISARKG